MTNYVNPKSSDGYVLGQSADDLVGFHGATPTVQVALSAAPAVATAAAISAAMYGFTSAQANAMVTLINALRAAVVSKGLAST